jgi:endonuclease YncB( thermonuclease family)
MSGWVRRHPMGALFGAVLLGMAVMVSALRWRVWLAPAPVAAGPVAGVNDRERGAFHLCRRKHRDDCVIDGDTIRYRGEKIRLADINAPEVSEPQCDHELDLGEQATDRMLALLNGGPFTLVPLPDRDEDVYGRKLRTITRGGQSLGIVLVREGLAEKWRGFRRDWCN